MPNVGKITALAILGAAAATAVATIWYQHRVSRRVLELWGPEAAALILQSPEVEVLELGTSSDQEAAIVIDRHDVTGARSINHLRRALLQDSTYDWNVTVPQSPVVWQAAIRFSDGAMEAEVLLSFDACRIALRGGTALALQPVACAELKALVQQR